jgi:hypothetical protein
MMCLFADLSLRLQWRLLQWRLRQFRNHKSGRSPCAAGLGYARHGRELTALCSNVFRFFLRLRQQPDSREPIAALPTSRHAHLIERHKLRCAQPVKHPNPSMAISIAVFFGSSLSVLRRRLTERLGSGVFSGDAPIGSIP